MNDMSLFASLQRVAHVDTVAVSTLLERVQALVDSGQVGTAVRPTRRWWLGLAAMLGIAFIAWRLFAIDTTPPRRLDIVRSSTSATLDFDEPPGLAGLLRHSDVVVVGRVAEVTNTSVQFTIEKVLRGEPVLQRIVVDTSALRALASHDMAWQPGARGLLFLVRSARSGQLELLLGEDGFELAGEGGYWGLLTQADVEDVIAHGKLAPARIVALLAQRGPRVLGQVLWHCQEFDGWRMPTTAPGFQQALATWWERTTSPELDDLLQAAWYLEPAQLRALTPTALARYQAGWITVAAAREARFIGDLYLGPGVRAGSAWAREQLLDVLAAIERDNRAQGKLTTDVREHLQLLELMALAEQTVAARRARELLQLVPESDRDARDCVMAAWAKWDPVAATPWIVAEFDRTFTAGEHRVPLGPLLACPEESARETLRTALAQRRFGDLYLEYDLVLRDVLDAARPNRLLASVAGELRARVSDPSSSTAAFLVFFRLHLAAGGTVQDARALPHFLTTALPDGVLGEQLVRTVEREVDVHELHFSDPTTAEVRAAASRLAKRLE